MTYPRYIKRKGKIYGPYYYKSVRDENGEVLNVYVGRSHPSPPEKNKEIPKPSVMKVTLFAAFLLLIFAFGFSYTSFFVAKEAAYTETLNITTRESMSYPWVPENPGNLTSFRLSGSIAGNGTARVYLKSKNETYLVFDSSLGFVNFTAEQSPVTGFQVLEQETNASEITAENMTGMPENAPEQENFTQDMQETSAIIGMNVSEGIIPYNASENAATGNATIPENASFAENLTRIEENATKPEIMNETYKETEQAEPLQIAYKFHASCIDTCALELSEKEYALWIEVENGTVLTIENVVYTVIEKKNSPPELIKSFPDMEIYPGDSATLNLSEYFSDPDGNPLSYSFLPNENLLLELTGSELSVSALNQAGIFTIVLNVSDGKDSILLEFMVKVIPAGENLTEEKGRLEGKFGIRIGNIEKAGEMYELDFEKEGSYIRLLGLNNISDLKEIKTTRIDKIRVRNKDARLGTPVFAADIPGIQAAEITLEKIGNVNAIVECPEYDFLTGTCPEWIPSGIPFSDNGTHIIFTINGFSGYAGAEITIINVYSHPTLGGNWTVEFNTTGYANLTVTAVNGTEWSDSSEGHDLRFLEIRCGDQVLNYTWIDNGPGNGSVFLENYSCNENGYETSKIITGGRHTLEFVFGNDTDYAYNTVFTCNSCTQCSEYLQNGTLQSGDMLSLTANLLGQSNHCIQFGGADNITFDCNGFTISGNGSTSVSYGIWLNESNGGSNNTIIRDCTNVSYFSRGVYLFRSHNSTLFNITTLYSNARGIALSGSDDCNVSFVNSYFTDYGVYIHTSNNTHIESVYTAENQETGIRLYFSKNNTLTNITAISNTNYGLLIEYSDNNTLTNITAINTSGYGIALFYSNLTFLNIVISNENSNDGIRLQYSINNTLTDITCTLNDYGIYSVGSLWNNLTGMNLSSNTAIGIILQLNSNYNNITSSYIENNTNWGISLIDSTEYNLIYNNYLNNTVNLPRSTNSPNYWNTTLNCSGVTNIIGGSCIGGNYWTDPDGSNFSDDCEDTSPVDGICDSQYDIATSNTDYLPLTEYAPPPLWHDNSTNGTTAGTCILHSLNWTDDAGLSGYIFAFYNGSNTTWQNTTSDLESGTINYTAAMGSTSSAFSENWDDGLDSDWTDALSQYAVSTTVAHSASYSERYGLGSGVQATLTKDAAVDLSGAKINGNVTWWAYIDSANDAGEYCCLDLSPDGTAWYNGTTSTNDCADANVDSEGTWISLYRTLNSTFMVSTFRFRFRCLNNGQNSEYIYTDDINVTYTSLDSDTNKTSTNYTDVLTVNVLTQVTNITATVNVSVYNNSGSAARSNNNSDLWLEMYNGTGWVSLGGFGITGTGNVSKSTQDSGILSAWTNLGNRDASIRGVYLDYVNSTYRDEINYTAVWVRIDSISDLMNDSWVAFTGTQNWSNVSKTVNSTHNALIKWCVYANDTSGNWNGTSCQDPFTYTVTDITPPNLWFVSSTLSNQSTTSQDWIYVNVSANENLDTCILDWVTNSTNLTMTKDASNRYCYANITGLSEGSYYFRVYGNDTVGNMNVTEDRQANVDLTPPYYQYDQDNSSGSVSEGDTVKASAYWNDVLSDLGVAILRTNGTGSWANEDYYTFSGKPEYSNFTISTSGYGSKTICWVIWANDSQGNMNSSMGLGEHCFNVVAGESNLTIESINIQPDEGNPGIIINPVEGSNKTANVTVTVTNSTSIDTCEVRIFNSSASYSDPIFLYIGTIQNCGATCECFREWDMEYWRNDGDWNVSVYINLTTGVGNFTSQNFTYNSLFSITVNTSTITFTGIPEQTVNSSDAYPLEIKNTGNQLVNISIKGTNFTGLSNPGYVVGVGNSTYNETQNGTFEQLTNNFVQIFEDLIPSEARNLFFRAYLPVGFIEQDYQNTIEITT